MREMKKGPTKFAIAVTVLLMFQSLAILAQPHINLKLYKPESAIAFLDIDSLTEEEPVFVTIRDARGEVLYKDKSKGADYTKMMDFTEIKYGRYYIDIEHPAMATRSVITKDHNGLSIEKDSYYLHNKITRLRGDDKKLLVKLNNKLNEPVTVRITDSEGHILHEKAGIKDSNFTALFNLSKLTSGEYNMQLISNNFSNSRSFQVE